MARIWFTIKKSVLTLFLTLLSFFSLRGETGGITYVHLSELSQFWIPNVGQFIDKNIAFVAKVPWGMVVVGRDNKIYYVLVDAQREWKYLIKEDFRGAANFTLKGVDPLPLKLDYILGYDKRDWVKGVRAYRGVSLGEIYPGIEVELRITEYGLEKIFKVNNPSKINSIKMCFKDVGSVKVEESKAILRIFLRFNLELESQDTGISFKHSREKGSECLLIVKDNAGEGVKSLVLTVKAEGKLEYTPLFSTADGISVSDDGTVYVAGRSYSLDVCLSARSESMLHGEPDDAYIAILDRDLRSFKKIVFIGGADTDSALGIEIRGGTVYLYGETSSPDFPAYRRLFLGKLAHSVHIFRDSAFITKWDLGLNKLEESVLLIGLDPFFLWGLDISLKFGAIYIAANGPLVSLKSVHKGRLSYIPTEMTPSFVIGLSLDLKRILFATFLEKMSIYTLKCGSKGIYVVGHIRDIGSKKLLKISDSLANFPWGAGILVLLDHRLTNIITTRVVWDDDLVDRHTQPEPLYSLLVTRNGDIYELGPTISYFYRPPNPGFRSRLNCGGLEECDTIDSFIACFDSDLSEYKSGTYLGGSEDDIPVSLVEDGEDILAFLITYSGDFPGIRDNPSSCGRASFVGVCMDPLLKKVKKAIKFIWGDFRKISSQVGIDPNQKYLYFCGLVNGKIGKDAGCSDSDSKVRNAFILRVPRDF